MAKVVLGLIQTLAGNDPQENLQKAIDQVRKASRQGAKIICLQELFRTLYFCQSEDHDHFKLAESIPGETTTTLSEIAKQEKVVIIAPVFEKRAEGIYHNSAVVIDADGSLLGTYRKMHVPDDPNFYEKFYFAPGDSGFQVYATQYARIGVLICWDQWFPEAARLAALRNAQILFYPTAIGWHESESKATGKEQLEAWQVVQRGHAVAN
ncbi:MAG TPA: nitrilase-related carbon-nitrogen hydrolase, partial [bacterium]|nr:nitrilase-related carbon-nitrogen hydrolase [bacterium]